VYSEQVLPERDEPTVDEGNRRAERARLLPATSYPVDPVSGGNWAGTGDLAVPAARAFDTAYRLALQHVLPLDATGEREQIAQDA
jgi:hypothetical protein